ncbi:MAG: carboxylating nicotinate-nucleotide diphosphorylase [Phycisphaeraceae bacterium]|nr:carboxylating nicotinate-nucleotide diphosphorylase [Phycisphaeraceae bacterium]
MPDLWSYITRDDLASLLRQARQEDLGPAGIDVTSELVVDAHQRATAVFQARQGGVLAGAAIVPEIVERYDKAVTLTTHREDGQVLASANRIATLDGPLRSILAIERVALNFMTHLSGIATLTNRFVTLIAGTKARIIDTRKTLPGLRALQKYAVVCGGGANHRMGLYDAVLVKDNHIAHLSTRGIEDAARQLAAMAAKRSPRPRFVEIEVDALDQLAAVLRAARDGGIDRVLLDNMPPEVLKQAVAMRDKTAPKVLLEASGGVRLETVRAIAEAGVDLISIGALTHSAPSLDIGLDIDRQA